MPEPVSPPPLIDPTKMPFDDMVGLVYDELTADGARAHVEVRPELLQLAGILHGGVYCSIVESVASSSAYQWLLHSGVARNVVGVNNNTDFLRPVSSGTLHVASSAIHRGRIQQLWQVVVTVDGDDRPVARGQVRLQNLPNAPDGR